MKKLFLLGTILIGLSACNSSTPNEQDKQITDKSKDKKTEVIFKDYGADPLVIDIENYTLENENYRSTIWTGSNLQLTVMAIPVGGEVGLEKHDSIEQFLRIEEGKAEVLMGDSKDQLTYVRQAQEDDAIFIPSGKWHNIINKGSKSLKLYSIYAKPEHPHGTIHKNKAESDTAHNE